jgi:hypothetical protein
LKLITVFVNELVRGQNVVVIFVVPAVVLGTCSLGTWSCLISLGGTSSSSCLASFVVYLAIMN